MKADLSSNIDGGRLVIMSLWSRDTPTSKPAPAKRHTVLRFIWRNLSNVILFTLIGFFAVVVLYPYMAVTVSSGQVGVLWKRFAGGTVIDVRQLKDEGLHIVLPWDKLFLYNLRLQSASQTYDAISSDGVNLSAKVNIRFRLRREYIAELHQAIGPDYANLLGPEIASRMREVISQYTAEEVYSTRRRQIQDQIRDRTVEQLRERYLQSDRSPFYRVPISDVGILYDTLLHDIELPTAVTNAINRKAEQFYIAEEYRYRVERERRESERKKIEAEGIRDFQQTVSQGISDSYLRWRGIEATLELSKSTNSKVVIIGGGKDGLPIILGNVDVPQSPRSNFGSNDDQPKDTTAPSTASAAGTTLPNGETTTTSGPRTGGTHNMAAAKPKDTSTTRTTNTTNLQEILSWLGLVTLPGPEPGAGNSPDASTAGHQGLN
jgi:prohibitin 2